MIRFENECVGCPPNMGCMGSACPYSHVPYLECDECGQDVDKLYDTARGQLCDECATSEEKEEYAMIDEENACEFTSPEEQDDYYDYADLAYEKMRDERYEDGE